MEEKKPDDFIVVAPEGQQALLTMGTRTFLIDCHTPLNLSQTFTHEQLANDAHLQANLEDGNLVRFIGQKLSKAPNSEQIKPLKEVAAVKIETKYTQKAETKTPAHRVKTATNIAPETKSDIQVRVVENKQSILAKDKEMLKSSKSEHNIVELSSRPPEQKPIDSRKLKMKVEMDVNPEEFEKRQDASRQRLAEEHRADHVRATEEIKTVEQEDMNN